MSGCVPVYWDIWASIACAVHSGAAWLIFSSKLFTWKQSDWICLSQVGSGSRADRRENAELLKCHRYWAQLHRLEKIILTLKVDDAVYLVDEAVHTTFCDHLGGDFFCLSTKAKSFNSREYFSYHCEKKSCVSLGCSILLLVTELLKQINGSF